MLFSTRMTCLTKFLILSGVVLVGSMPWWKWRQP